VALLEWTMGGFRNMETMTKPEAFKILHNPHRLQLSGAAPGDESLKDEFASADEVTDFELASVPFEVSSEIVVASIEEA